MTNPSRLPTIARRLASLALVALALAVLLLAGCRGAPSAALTTARSLNAPSWRAPANAPLAQATVAGSTTPTPAKVAPALQALADAVAKTRAATTFRLVEDFAASSLLSGMPGDSSAGPTQLLHAEAQVNGKDIHALLKGVMAAVFGADPDRGFEFTRVGTKNYVRGPVSLYDAPDDKWYQIDNTNGSFGANPLSSLDELASVAGDWSAFGKTRSGDSLDGQSCDVYTAGKDLAAQLLDTIYGMPAPSVLDKGAVEVALCADGYVHSITANITGRASGGAEQNGTATLSLRMSDLNGKITITAPADAIVQPTATATRSAAVPSAVTPGTSAYAGYDGQWEGSTSADTTVSFGIVNNQFTYVNLNYAARSGDCYLSGSFSTSPDRVVTANRGFSMQLTDGDGKQFTFAGTFASTNQITGTLQVKGPTKNCGPIDAQSTWTAARIAPLATFTPVVVFEPTARPTASRTPAATRTPTPVPDTDASVVLANLIKALNARNVDAALAYFGADPIVDWGPVTTMDRDELKGLLADLVKRPVTYQVSNLTVVGGEIGYFTLKETGAAATTYGKSSVITHAGKIEILGIR